MKFWLPILFLCFVSRSFAQAPSATISVASPTVCSNTSISFSATTTNTPTAFVWNAIPSSGISNLIGSGSFAFITFRNSGVYTVSLTVSNSSGTTTAVKSVTVVQTPTASFSASLTTYGFPNQLDLTNFSNNASSYSWLYSDSGTADNTTDATHTYSVGGSYTVSLVAYNKGCTDTSRYSFYISDSSGVTLPNVFTPNGDGVNDIFKPIAHGITSLKVSIYSRWGNHIYTWETVNGWWDGHTTSGSACTSGQYFCVLEATGFDGKSYKLNTVLTLINDN